MSNIPFYIFSQQIQYKENTQVDIASIQFFQNIRILETPFYIFYECDLVRYLWIELKKYFQNRLILPTLTAHCHFWITDAKSLKS